MTSSNDRPAPLSGTLALYTSDPALPYFDTDPSLPHALVFIGGLTNTIGEIPYLARLAAAVAPIGYSLVQPQLTSCLGGYGYTSLESDSRELAALVEHLRKEQKDRIVFMGHSTGCQDCMAFLSKERGDDVAIDGAILQAPVSDRQDFEHSHAGDGEPDESLKLLQLAENLVKEGKGNELLPRSSMPPSPQEDRGANRSARYSPPMTAYRYFSLNGKGGDDDYFSSDLGDGRTVEVWRTALAGLRKPSRRAGGGRAVLAAIVGAEDEYIPEAVGAAMLYSYWKSLMPEINDGGADAATLQTLLLPGADHQVSAPDAQSALVKAAVRVCQSVLGDGTSTVASREDQHLALSLQQTTLSEVQSEPTPSPAPPHPPSFDEIVELISTGRADSIPGVRDIPLKINEEQPSRSAMSRPLKPWERTAAQDAPQQHQT